MYTGPGYQNMISHATPDEATRRLADCLRFYDATPQDAYFEHLREGDAFDKKKHFNSHFQLHWTSYKGWRVYMYMTGCLASDPAYEKREGVILSLALAFAIALREYMGEDNLQIVIDRNHADTNKTICHSHDFCDANQIMLDACESLTLTDTESLQFDGVWDEIMDFAWNKAKADGFRCR